MATTENQAKEASPSTALGLPDWLKQLTSRGVDMRVAMALASKIYKSHGTKERLAELDAKKLMPLVPDKDQRKAVLNAVKGIKSGVSPTKKRTRDSDLMEPLRNRDEDDVPKSLEFNEILDTESLIPVTITTNRAPVKTAWAYTVARRLGFDLQESLSIAHVYVHFSSLKHALKLGNILNAHETREAEDEIRELPAGPKDADGKGKGKAQMWGKAVEGERGGSSQPWIDILRARIPVIERPDGTWRAIQQGVAVQPSVAYLYITKAFKDYTPHVLGAMKLVAATYSADELNRVGMSMYNDFKPDVVEWGQRGFLECAKVLDQANGPVSRAAAEGKIGEEAAINGSNGDNGRPSLKPVQSGDDIPPVDESSDLSDPQELVPPAKAEQDDPFILPELGESPLKKRKAGHMTVEEYEEMLDAEDRAGGFLEAVDIFEASHAK